jgi:RNA polymerase sigma-70 factor (ECF subfamily)
VPGVRAFFDQWYPALVRSLRVRLGDTDLAEDIAQEAFVRLLDHRPRDPRAWLFTVAGRLVSDHSRRTAARARRLALVAEAEPAVGPPPAEDPSALVVRAEAVDAVRAALGRLTERDRTLLLLHHGGHSYAEVAARIGVVPASVGPLLTRAQRRFARAYGTPTTHPQEEPGVAHASA